MSQEGYKFPFAVSVAIGLQTVMAVLWVGAASARLNHLEASLSRMSALEVRAARLEEQSLHLRDALHRIEAKLDYALHSEGEE